MKQFCLVLMTCLLGLGMPAWGLTILVDGSGSMEGFAKTGAITRLVTEIVGQAEESPRILLFTSSDGRTVPPPKEIGLRDLGTGTNFRGKYTLLGALAERHLQDADPGNYLIITDNVEDEPQTQGDSKKFYDRLGNLRQISSVDISPRILEFEGNPYRGIKKWYQGPAGLLVYFINIGADQAAAQANHKLLKRVTEAGHTVFHIRPINSDHLQLKAPANPGKFSLYSKKGRYYLKLSDRGQGKSTPMIQIDKPYPIRFSILMESRYPYIGLAKGTSVGIEDFRIGFPGIDLNMKVAKPDIDPSSLPKELEEGGKQLFAAKLRVTPTAPSLGQRLASMFIPKKGKVSFDMVLGTSRNSVYMLPAIRDKYFTDSANEYDKIYSSLDIISHFNPQDNKIVFHVANEDDPRDPSTQIGVMYDNGWVFLLLLLILALLAGLGILIYRWFKAPNQMYLYVEVQPGDERIEREIGRFETVPLEPCVVKRKLSAVTAQLLDTNLYYFRNSYFKSLDLPPKVVREIVERNTDKVYRICIDHKRRKDA